MKHRVLLVGSPNAGKSLLFNRLTGLHHKVANFPGATVDVSEGACKHDDEAFLVDFPGVYSLNTVSPEEKIAVDNFLTLLKDPSTSLVICVLDATRLEKCLFFALQVARACAKLNKPMLLAGNMMDVIEKHKLAESLKPLSESIGIDLIPVSGKTGMGMDQLVQAIDNPSSVRVADQIKLTPEADLQESAHQLAKQFATDTDLLIRTQNKLDHFFLQSRLGVLCFVLVMFLVFQSIFTWAAPLMDGVEAAVSAAASWFLPYIKQPIFHDFVADALFGGLGAFLVFVPQIFILTFIIGTLEDSGYLSRAAVICHRPLKWFGLTGKSFIPMLSGIACAIPGIYAARTIDSPRKRWLTYFAIPLMPCSARLPVYTLLILVLIPDNNIAGIIGLQGLAMFGLYFFGIFAGLIASAVVSKAQKNQEADLPFVLEMPPYRMPSWVPLIRMAWNRSKLFLVQAAPVIFWVTVVVWVLGYFPNPGQGLETSWLAALGKWIQPIFEPLGLDWRYGVAILTSFIAREVFVGTLGTLFGLEGTGDEVASLASQIDQSGLTTASGVALLLFYTIALQCVSTLAVLKRESGSWKLPTQIFFAYSVWAYVTAWLGYLLVKSFSG